MAANTVQIGGNGMLFVGEDKQILLELLDSTYNPAVVGSGIPIDMTGWALQFVVRLRDNTPDPPVISKLASVTGTYNSVRATNTQRAVVQLLDVPDLAIKAKAYRHSWKRLDEGFETVVARGDFIVELATQT